MVFEKMARNTDFSLFNDPNYRDKLYNALVFPLKLRVDDTSTIRLNDGHGSLRNNQEIYEYAYSYFAKDELMTLLNACYAGGERESIDALLYGVDDLDNSIVDPLDNYFYHVFTDQLLWVKTMFNLPFVDTKKVAVMGASQGGGTSLIMAALEPRIALCRPAVPSYCCWEAHFHPHRQRRRYCKIH
jgi:hypothetical protein